MSTYLVAFQLGDEKIYAALADYMRGFPKWAMVMRNVWIVKDAASHTAVRDMVSSTIRKLNGSQGSNGSSVIVTDMGSRPWATYAVDKGITDWMRENV